MGNVIRQVSYRYFLSLAGVTLVTLGYKFLHLRVNSTTVALSFLLVVLLSAAIQGIGPAIAASLASMLSFNFFFLPPVGTFTITDPQNWVALFVFLVTAIVASQLSSTARKRAWEAEKSREEVWKLYQLSRAIIVTPDPETAVSTLSRQVRDVFGVTYCEIYSPKVTAEGEQLAIASGASPSRVSSNFLLEVFEKGEIRTDNEGTVYAPLKVGMRVTGVIVLDAGSLEDGTIEAISGLVALALERARFLKELSRTEALRQSDQLKSAILASVSHDLHTPLTSIRAAVDNLLESTLNWDREALHEFHLIIREEVNRLTHLVQNLLEMARIEAGELHPVREWGTVAEIFDNVLERSALYLNNHHIGIELNERLPMVKVDSRLLAQVLNNLVENAVKYSPDQSRIFLRGTVGGEGLTITVRDHGSGVPPQDLAHVFEKFYRGTSPPGKKREGTGMGLAIARGIVEAHGGRIWIETPPGGGAIFAFNVPAETKEFPHALDHTEESA
jgi:two-component system, OmpR family, sensor histidine kinase KdpD